MYIVRDVRNVVLLSYLVVPSLLLRMHQKKHEW